MNRVLIHGRLARDPEIRTTQSGQTIARLTVAVDRPTKERAADFIPCVAFSKTAELIGNHFVKGKEIIIEGRIQTGSYVDDEGKKRYTTDVIIDRVEFCGSKSDGGKETAAQQDIPF